MSHTNDQIREAVREQYGAVARRVGSDRKIDEQKTSVQQSQACCGPAESTVRVDDIKVESAGSRADCGGDARNNYKRLLNLRAELLELACKGAHKSRQLLDNRRKHLAHANLRAFNGRLHTRQRTAAGVVHDTRHLLCLALSVTECFPEFGGGGRALAQNEQRRLCRAPNLVFGVCKV